MNESVLQDALRLRRAGKLAEAAQLYSGILRNEPHNFEALHALGILRYQSGLLEEAEQLIGQAVVINPAAADAQYNRASLLLKLNRTEEALHAFDRALALKPDYVEALGNRGAALLRLGRAAEAFADLDRLVRLRPDLLPAWANHASALMALNRPSEAVASFDKATSLKPDLAQLWKGRAAALMAAQRTAEALASLEKSLAIDPKNPDTLVQRADLLLWLKRYSDALLAYEAFISVDPNYSEAWNKHGVTLVELRRQNEALNSFARAVLLDSGNADAWNNRANVLFELKRFEEAALDFQEALKLAPDLPYVEGFLIQCRLRVCDWGTLEDDRERLAAGIAAGKRIIDPQGNLSIERSPEGQLRCSRIFMAEEPLGPPMWRGERYAHDRIRVAYLTADFRPHPVAFLVAGVFEHHDRSRFETIGISFGPGAGSDIRNRIEAGFEHFHDVRNTPDSDVAALLKRMEVDVAVDLMAFTDGCRPSILAERPAPVQVNFLGFPGTSGAPHLDYIIADRILIPEQDRRFFSEQVAYMPETYQANDSKRAVAQRTPTRADAGLPENAFVFCCFNNNYKILPDVFDIWMRLLHGVEGSVLWLLQDSETAAANLRREAAARGVAPERLLFASRTTPPEHLARQKLADLFLDTSPYGAHTTCSDALWVGLPVVTFRGATFPARVAGSLLHAAGLPELATDSPAEYERLALSLARDKVALAALKAKLDHNRSTCALFDTARFTRNLEQAFETMVRRHRAGEPPRSFFVGADA